MKALHVALLPGELPAKGMQQNQAVIVIDVLRASTSIIAALAAGALAIAAYYNAAAAAQWATAQLEQGRELVIACAGTRRRFTLEDACAAGMIVQLIMANVTGVTLSDAANAAVALWQSFDGNALRTLQASQHGQYLASAGFARDIAFCAQTSKEGLVPQLEEQILLPVLFNSCICRDG